MQLPRSIGLPSFGEPTYRIIVVSSGENLVGRLTEDLRPHDLDARQFRTIHQGLAHSEESVGDTSPFTHCTILVTASSKLRHWRGEIWNRRKDGGAYAEWLTVSALRGLNGAIEGYLTLFTDIMSRKIREEHLEHQALHDPLTALPNRLLLEDRFTLAIAQAKRSKRYLALAFLDLDGFKEANDQFGHATGDQVLIVLAKRLQGVLRSSDTVSRLGGDEFVCLLNDLEGAGDATTLADKILNAAAEPYLIEGQTLELSVSIGLGVYPENGGDFATLLQFADSAMYRAKAQGKNRYFWH